MKSRTTRIGAGEFKGKCLHLMEEVRRHRGAVAIAKRGTPVAKLVPVDDERPGLYGWLRGTVIIKDDIVGRTTGKWAAQD